MYILISININLRKYNLEHVHSTFLVIELPMSHNLDDVSTLYTIGMLYKEIEQCIKILTDDIFKEVEVDKEGRKWILKIVAEDNFTWIAKCSLRVVCMLTVLTRVRVLRTIKRSTCLLFQG